MKINNSLNGKLEEFEPIKPKVVNMYTCGVTVYDDCHIGHARSLYVFDVMRRYLEYRGYKVNFVRNITDIDDKIIKRANELKIDWKELVKKYIDSYREDLKLLGVRPGMLDKDKEEPRATKNIEDIKKYIQALIDKGYAYATNTGVYFSVRKFKGYGKLSGQSVDQMLVGVRKESDETKEDPLDFALWKVSGPGEPSWPSPWGDGRPGWHIECSVMSTKYLKTDTLDIHAGGLDLIFPHHENEIAQSEAKSGKQFAKYWIHHGLLTIDNQKMAKSLGNFITLKDFLAKYKDADYLKLLFLNTHYRHPVDYTGDNIDEMRKKKERINIFIRYTKDVLEKVEKDGGRPDVTYKDHGDLPWVNMYKLKFEAAMDDDFNTPKALAEIFNMISDVNSLKIENDADSYLKVKLSRDLVSELLTNVFGLSLKDDIFTDVEMELMKEYVEARKRKEYKKSDEFRQSLANAYNIIAEDTKDGTRWRRKI